MSPTCTRHTLCISKTIVKKTLGHYLLFFSRFHVFTLSVSCFGSVNRIRTAKDEGDASRERETNPAN